MSLSISRLFTQGASMNAAKSIFILPDAPSCCGTAGTVCREFVILQGQEMMPAWGGLLPALRSGAVPWAEAHPAETAAGRDFWKYMEVGSPEQFMKRAGLTSSAVPQ